MSTLRMVDVNKIYPNGFHAVHNFNLDIKDGEFIVFVGPSGCGKSTTLRMIAGLEEISKGEFYIDDELANNKSSTERGIAMVFQSYALYPHLTVYDNLAFGLNLKGVDGDVVDVKVKKVAQMLGLTEYLERKPRELSGGQRQRVAVGRAIIRKTKIMLFDEPLSNLDAKQRVTMRSEIAQLHEQTHSTTIYVTHDQTEAMTLADRIVVMKDGYIQQIGSPEELYFNPCNVFVAAFIGEPPMNILKGNLAKKKLTIDGTKVEMDASKTKYALKDGKSVLGFRPEDALLEDNGSSFKFTGKVTLCELLGDSTNVYLQIDDVSLIIKIDPHMSPEIDDNFTFYIPYDKVYLFDGETEKVLNTK